MNLDYDNLTLKDLDKKIAMVTVPVEGFYWSRTNQHMRPEKKRYEADILVPVGFDLGDVKRLIGHSLSRNEDYQVDFVKAQTWHVIGEAKPTSETRLLRDIINPRQVMKVERDANKPKPDLVDPSPGYVEASDLEVDEFGLPRVIND